MNGFDGFHFLDLEMDSVFENFESFRLVGFEMPFDFLFLFFSAIFVDELNDSHGDDAVDEGADFILSQRGIVGMKDFIEHCMGFVEPHHVKVKLIPFIFRFEEINFIGVFEPHVEVFFGAVWDRNVNVVEESLEDSASAFASVRVRIRHQDITRRRPVAITKIQIIERLKQTQPSPI
jgi:hypothetical protein